MHFRQALLSINGKTYPLTPGRANSFDELYVDFQQVEVHGGQRYSLFLHPKQDIIVHGLEVQFDLPSPADARFFANGYQSWSESRWLPVTDSIPRLRSIARKTLGRTGDDFIPGIPPGLHSWTYFALKADHPVRPDIFAGSLHEQTGFTLFLYDQPNGILTVRKDVEHLQLAHSFPGLDFWVTETGVATDQFDRYCALAEIKPPVAPPALGWTSRGHRATDLSVDMITKNLESVTNSGLPFTCFQIDDGWQTAVGDWRTAKPAFPGGMAGLAAAIQAKGLQPGLWMAPFVAAKDSDLVKKHPEWLLKDARGQPIRVGKNPQWGGWYYALDFYHPEVRDYLSGVFHVVCAKWGYELLNLDFLFAVCLVPPVNKTRGQVMHEAMEFLRQCVGSKQLLAGGVPLGAGFGLADYGRMGSDTYINWEQRWPAWLHHRERASTLSSLRSTLGRWQLNGRIFHNATDACSLRTNNHQLTPIQQSTVLTIQALLGSLLFMTDDLADYTPEQMAALQEALDLRGSQVHMVTELLPDVYRLDAKQAGVGYVTFCNLTQQPQSIPTNLPGLALLDLLAGETITLRYF